MAMTARTGLTLRLLGPLIEVVCVILLLRVRDQGKQLAGVPIEYPLYAGLAIGLGLVVAGLILSQNAPRRPRDPG
jgi:hypothetical protein